MTQYIKSITLKPTKAGAQPRGITTDFDRGDYFAPWENPGILKAAESETTIVIGNDFIINVEYLTERESAIADLVGIEHAHKVLAAIDKFDNSHEDDWEDD